MRRINVIGTTGSGKSTLARKLALLLSTQHVELDSIFWKPNWVESTRDEMRRNSEPYIEQETWVIDGNYSYLQEAIWARAEVIVWLDTPKWWNLWSVAKRGVLRATTRQKLWGHSRESLGRLLSRKSILLWAWSTHARRKAKYESDFQRMARTHDSPKLCRLRDFWEADVLLATLQRRPGKSLVEKALVYVVRGEPGAEELLVFTHPLTGLVEVVRGTVEEREEPQATARRELVEEANVSIPRLPQRFSVQSAFIRSGADQTGPWEYQLHHAFVVTGDGTLSKEWEHSVTGGGLDDRLKFRFHWIRVKDAEKALTPGTGAFLQDLRAFLSGTTIEAGDLSQLSWLTKHDQSGRSDAK